jgi:hypothetical protein
MVTRGLLACCVYSIGVAGVGSGVRRGVGAGVRRGLGPCIVPGAAQLDVAALDASRAPVDARHDANARDAGIGSGVGGVRACRGGVGTFAGELTSWCADERSVGLLLVDAVHKILALVARLAAEIGWVVGPDAGPQAVALEHRAARVRICVAATPAREGGHVARAIVAGSIVAGRKSLLRCRGGRRVGLRRGGPPARRSGQRAARQHHLPQALLPAHARQRKASAVPASFSGIHRPSCVPMRASRIGVSLSREAA